MPRLFFLPLALPALAVLVSTGAGANARPAMAQQPTAVTIADFSFSPASVTVKVGQAVRWTNSGQAPHTATADNNSFDSKTLNNGGTFSFTFNQAGSIAYHCNIHPSMTATVVVEAAAQATATRPAATTAPATATATRPAATTAPTNPPPAASPSQAAASGPAAKIVDFAFEPGTIQAKVGDTVTWTHAGQAPHTVTADTGAFDSGRLAAGGTFSFRFDTPGKYPYKCAVHPARMTGVVEVAGATGATQGGEAGGAKGSASFSESRGNRTDQVRVEVNGLKVPQGNAIAWLVNSANGDAQKLGELKPDDAGKATLAYTDSQKRNLIALFDRMVVTAENGQGGNKPAGQELMRDEIPSGAMVHIRHLLAKFDPAPGGTALSTGLLEQSDIAAAAARDVRAAARANNLANFKTSLERLINTLEGEKSAQFGDINGDEKRDNPGDGFGLLNYANGAAEHARLAAEAAPRDQTVTIHGGHVDVSAKNALQWLTQARDLALPLTKAANTASVVTQADQIADLVDAALNGRDANKDGRVDPVAGEGGAATAYAHSQLMATLEPTEAQAQQGGQGSQSGASPAATSDAAAAAAGDDENNGTNLVLIAAGGAVAIIAALVGGFFLFGRKQAD